ncbi:MAG: hypothetical protein ABEK50_06190 [bacterium]
MSFTAFRHWLSLSLLVGFLLFFALSPLLQSSFVKNTSSPSISGFFGLSWGTKRKNLELYMKDFSKDPLTETVETGNETDATLLLYRNVKVLDVKTNIGFLFDEGEELIMGFFLAPFDVKEQNCETIYRTFREKINNDYPSLPSAHERRNQLEAPFCNAVAVGSAGQLHHWTDRNSLAQIQLKVGMGLPGHVMVLFASPQYVKWIRRHDRSPEGVIKENVLPALE